jgi:UDP-glucose 4-epimerase
MNDRVLVTGAGGFVGQHLVQSILETETNTSIVATDIESKPPERYASQIGDRIEYVQGDITEEAFRAELLSSRFNRIYHLAAIVGVDQYVSKPLDIVEVNVVATKAILERVSDWDVRFVFTSTSEVYGKNEDLPWSETTDRVLGPPTIDRWSYSTGKSMCEHMIHGLAESDSPFSATVIRPFNLYGPGQRPKFVISAFIEAVAQGEIPTVYDDGTQTRCFTYIDDFIDGMLRASRRSEGKNQVFNIGNSREIEIRSLARIVLDKAGMPDATPEFIDTDELYGDTYEDLDRRVPETTKAEARLNWTATTSLEEGIEKVLAWRENGD